GSPPRPRRRPRTGRRRYGSRVLLAADHLADPLRRERRGAVGRGRVVAQYPEPFAHLQRPRPQLRVLDADVRERCVHLPLQPLVCVGHLGLDHVQQLRQCQPFRLLDHAVGGQRPAGARDHRVGVVQPGQAQLFGVRALHHDVGEEPGVGLARARVPQHRVELIGGELPRPAHEQREQPRVGVAGLPQLQRERVVLLDPLGDRPQLGEVHRVLVAVPLVHGQHLGVGEPAELGYHVVQNRLRRGHTSRSYTRGSRPYTHRLRLWSIHPDLLDRAALVAGWREGLLARKALRGLTPGYRNRLLAGRVRTLDDPVAGIASGLAALADAADARGYRFDRARITVPAGAERLTLTEDQLDLEWAHLRAKVYARDPAWAERL